MGELAFSGSVGGVEPCKCNQPKPLGPISALSWFRDQTGVDCLVSFSKRSGSHEEFQIGPAFQVVPECPVSAWVAQLVGGIHLKRQSVGPCPCRPLSFVLFGGCRLHL